MEQNRFKSKFGFLISAIGGAVGLGNIWMFPYKLQKYGGLFLYTYLLLSFTIGVTLLSFEFILGKHFRCNVMQLYRANTTKIKYIGLMTVISPLIILMYYCAAGGMCIKYLLLNLFKIFDWNFELQKDCTFILIFIFIILIYLIDVKGMNEGIEKFNKFTVPLLMVSTTIWAVILIVNDNCDTLKEFFVLNKNNTLKESVEIFAVSSEQMFFSLSIAVGTMITYGALMPDRQKAVSSAFIVTLADTFFALIISVVIISSAKTQAGSVNGPNLVFTAMQNVFDSQGNLGNFLGILFYLSIIIAALTSAVSYIEVPVSALLDSSTLKRKKALLLCLIITVLPAIYIGQEGFGIVYRAVVFASEGILVPLTAFLSTVNFSYFYGWKFFEKFVNLEIKQVFFKKIYLFILKYIVECVIITVIIVQILVYL